MMTRIAQKKPNRTSSNSVGALEKTFTFRMARLRNIYIRQENKKERKREKQ